MASGKFGGGNGSASTPYLIEDVKDLNAIRFFPDKCFKLTQSINLSVYPYNTNSGWLPIANFCGQLDGDGHKIINLYINRPNIDNVGFFSVIFKKTNIDLVVKNLYFDNATVYGNNNVGVVAGAINIQETVAPQTNYFFEKLKITGTINGSNQVGAVLGRIYWDGTFAWTPNFILNSRTTVKVTVKSSGVDYSGLVGYGALSRGTIKVSHFISDCSFSNIVAGATTTLNPNHWTRTDTNGITYDNSFYSSDTWTYGTKTNNKTNQELSVVTLGDFDKQINPDGTLVWSFKKNDRVVDLNLFLFKKHFIKTSKGYYIYDFDKSQWVKKFDKPYTREQLIANAMDNVDNIPFKGWDALKALLPSGETTFDLIDIIEDSNGTTYTESILNMDLDSTHTAGTDKKLFSKKITFVDSNGKKLYGDTIVQIDKGIIK